MMRAPFAEFMTRTIAAGRRSYKADVGDRRDYGAYPVSAGSFLLARLDDAMIE
jgi:hypothetical protein